MTVLSIQLAIVIFIQIVTLISIVKHLKVILQYLSYQCDSMDKVIEYGDLDEAYKEVC